MLIEKEHIKNPKNRNKSIRKVDYIRCGALNWNKQHDSQDKTKKMSKLPLWEKSTHMQNYADQNGEHTEK